MKRMNANALLIIIAVILVAGLMNSWAFKTRDWHFVRYNRYEHEEFVEDMEDLGDDLGELGEEMGELGAELGYELGDVGSEFGHDMSDWGGSDFGRDMGHWGGSDFGKDMGEFGRDVADVAVDFADSVTDIFR